MVEGNKQVRVDNWGTFFLQRLQVFFAKTDYCDLTLQFDGNVQLKVHRLVMNACTEYFRFLEETCPALEENTILMPSDLQSDVIVPIVNFMYTGMLEFHISLYDKLYKAAELMNISILTKLLEAQKISHFSSKPVKPKQEKRQIPIRQQQSFTSELPPALPGRKVPVWKRKTAPAVSTPIHTPSALGFEQKWHTPTDPLSVDNTAKPTRFEWPEDDLPTMTLMDTSFEDISYTSKPLLTREEEEKIKPNFDDLRNNIELPAKKNVAKVNSNSVNFKEIEEFSKEQKIRTAMFEDIDEINEANQKRKAPITPPVKVPTKKIKISSKENKETTISVESNTPGDIDHTKIVTEILKKYPDLVKRNKNIKLKIMPGNKESGEKKVVNAVVEQVKQQTEQVVKTKPPKQFLQRKTKLDDTDEEGPWVCKKCISTGGEVQEFVLYYLYRKHMTDVHDEVFDSRLCKYCGRKCNNHNLMMYHMYTKHALKPPQSYIFPKCEKCPFIALSEAKLSRHKQLHNTNEMQCQDCKLAFTSTQTLTSHIRITGHYNKPGRVSYDCQYCMKKLQTSITLLSHIRKSHLHEGKRDGIVCLEELDSIDDLEEENEETVDGGEDYNLPEILSDSLQKDKVKIISNVKVPPKRQDAQNQQNQIVSLESNSETETLSNVATDIATSLNLVDIVVLDENQQYILQQDGQNEQEFIIPELAHGQPFTGQVITTQDSTVLQQGMIQSSSGDIASTDELVMVLTDHDYQDEHEGENPENSNIVVLYSHPVEGQEGQFITTQGNLMVNSQTGLLEIRNGSTISTSAASQMVVTNSVDSPIESIEMIQREIDSQVPGLKQEAFFEEDLKSQSLSPSEQHTAKLQNMPDLQGISEPETLEVPLECQPENHDAIEEEQTAQESQEESEEHPVQTNESLNKSSESHDEKDTSEDNIDGSLEVNNEEPMDIEVEHKTAETEELDDSVNEENVEDQQTQVTRTKTSKPSTEDDDESSDSQPADGVDIPPDNICHITEEVVLNDPAYITTDRNEYHPSINEETQKERIEEPMEIDGKVDLERTLEKNLTLEEKTAVEEQNIKEKEADNEIEEETEFKVANITDSQVSHEELAKETEDEHQLEEPKEISEEGISTRDVSSTKSAEINRTILDDWEEDTDSQQSEKNIERIESQICDSENSEKMVGVSTAVDNVNKLMDDWDEEEEDEKKC